MKTIDAYNRGLATAGNVQMVFDWDNAAQLIRELKPAVARAGLAGDWEYTGGIIYREGIPVFDDYTYLASTWAVPELMLDGDTIPCWRFENEVQWGRKTKWPESALAILRGERAG